MLLRAGWQDRAVRRAARHAHTQGACGKRASVRTNAGYLSAPCRGWEHRSTPCSAGPAVRCRAVRGQTPVTFPRQDKTRSQELGSSAALPAPAVGKHTGTRFPRRTAAPVPLLSRTPYDIEPKQASRRGKVARRARQQADCRRQFIFSGELSWNDRQPPWWAESSREW